ncbi:MAG: SpoIIE family protein phosphatase, partial [Candidatus Cellulosilyticum pullistercoris]|nr:SpoIIE family protein phosphatase [Candidatus Cellulosilyticum pullistercoris]
EKYCYFALGVKKQFSLVISAQNQAKEAVSGDSYSFMELSNGKYLMALADGMGSGYLAQQESKMTIELLENFLEAGFDNEVALRIINSALVLKSDVECYATMDMALIDQYTGVIEFLKMGASTSFIVRGDEVITVKASSFPIGILSHVDIVSCKKQLKDGDIIIMVTDGMLENKNDRLDREITFKHFISESKSNSPEYMAKFLLDKTKNLMAGEETDDMTIIVARIWKQD